jgi:hypothetical protein
MRSNSTLWYVHIIPPRAAISGICTIRNILDIRQKCEAQPVRAYVKHYSEILQNVTNKR